jgi:branched-chain amino acid transport system substrate-binding protein
MRGRPGRTAMALILLGTITFMTGCGSGTPTQAAPSVQGETPRLYGVDANMDDSFGAAFKASPGALAGMKGTTPRTPLSAEFTSRLRAINPALSSLAYTGEAYDAVAIAVIAAQYARSTDPGIVAKYIVPVTTGGTVCETISACLDLAKQGTDLQYRGITMRRGGLTDTGDPSTATYGTVSFSRANLLDDARTEYVEAGDASSQSTAPSPAPTKATHPAALIIGGLLPHTGRLSSFGPPLTAAIRSAIDDTNAAGGVNGASVGWVDGDDGTSGPVATSTVDRLVGQGVQVIIGAGASSVTKAVLPQVVAAGRILISPTSTSDELTTLEDNGLFFRTAPPDTLQAKALADVMLRDGQRRIAIVAIDGTYGTGLADSVQANLVLGGIKADSIRRSTYPEKASYDAQQDAGKIFDPIAADIRSFGPDAVLVVGSDESAYLVQALFRQWSTPSG